MSPPTGGHDATSAPDIEANAVPSARRPKVVWRRWWMSALAVVVGIAGAWWIVSSRPSLEIPQDVPEEVTVLAQETWDAYLSGFPAHRGCIGSVTLLLVRAVDGGDAVYRAADRTISIEIPTTPERFTESLAHELGHHLETACEAPDRIGAAFREAQGLRPESEWAEGEFWFEIPSEHFAEAVVETVLDTRITHADVIEIEPETLDLVRVWGETGRGDGI